MGWDARRRLRAAAGFALVLFALVLFLKNDAVDRDNRRLAAEALDRERKTAEDQRRLIEVIEGLQAQVRELGGRPIEIPAEVLESLAASAATGASRGERGATGPQGPAGPPGPPGPATSSTATTRPATPQPTTHGEDTTTTTRPPGTSSTSTSTTSTTTSTTRPCTLGLLGFCLVD
jgi:hypothetical protein